jgi:hypothetical protein
MTNSNEPPIINAERDPISGRWMAGNTASRGRAPGVRNKLARRFLQAMMDDFAEHGPEAIAETRRRNPASYIRSLVLITRPTIRDLPHDEEAQEFDGVDPAELRAKLIEMLPEIGLRAIPTGRQARLARPTARR